MFCMAQSKIGSMFETKSNSKSSNNNNNNEIHSTKMIRSPNNALTNLIDFVRFLPFGFNLNIIQSIAFIGFFLFLLFFLFIFFIFWCVVIWIFLLSSCHSNNYFIIKWSLLRIVVRNIVCKTAMDRTIVFCEANDWVYIRESINNWIDCMFSSLNRVLPAIYRTIRLIVMKNEYSKRNKFTLKWHCQNHP